jgi:hypothetical protein
MRVYLRLAFKTLWDKLGKTADFITKVPQYQKKSSIFNLLSAILINTQFDKSCTKL